MGRRAVLRGGALGGAGLAAAALIGCGSDDDDEPGGGGGNGGDATSTATAGNGPEPDYVTQAREDGAPYPYNYPEPSDAPKTGGTLRIAVPWEPSTFDVNTSAAADTVSVANIVANRLIGMVSGPELNKYEVGLEPSLAKDWELSPDGLTYTFNLQEGVKFHNVEPVNGRDFTAKDVVESYERARSGGANAAFFQLADQITAPDDHTVRITMKTPDADFLIPLASKALSIYPSELYDQNLIDSVAIGTGPGILGEVQRGSYVRIKANPDYWEGKPHLDGLEWQTIKDSSAQLAAFRAGQVDFAFSLDTTKQGREALERSNPDTRMIADPILVGITRIGLNTSNPKFQDERVRQALHLTVDRETYLQLVQQGLGRIMPGFGWPFLFDKEPTGEELGRWWRYDLEEAKQLLSAAGAENLEFDLNTAISYTPTIDSTNVPLTEFFRAAGVTMNLRNIDYAAFNAQYYGRKYAEDGGDAIQGWSTQAPSANGYFYDAMYSQSAKNYYNINDPEIDDWATRQRSELDPEARKQLQRNIWDKTLDQVYYIDQPTNFGFFITQPWVRYYRFNSPYIALHWYYEWGVGFHKAWLDK